MKIVATIGFVLCLFFSCQTVAQDRYYNTASAILKRASTTQDYIDALSNFKSYKLSHKNKFLQNNSHGRNDAICEQTDAGIIRCSKALGYKAYPKTDPPVNENAAETNGAEDDFDYELTEPEE
jgi:hypothetical protein